MHTQLSASAIRLIPGGAAPELGPLAIAHCYHVQRRVERAKHLLLVKEFSLTAITDAVGFTSQSYFDHHFKRFTGLTPRAFLKQYWRIATVILAAKNLWL